MSFVIPLDGLKQSSNAIYAGQHWAKRKKFADSVHDRVRIICRKFYAIESYPVQILYQFVFASRALDSTNCSYMVKALEDALRSCQLLEDDDPTHVARTIIEVTKKERTKLPGVPKARKLVSKTKEDFVTVTITQL